MSEKGHKQQLYDSVWSEIATVQDPDLGIPLTELGLIYELRIDDDGIARVKMTFTSMACPLGPQMVEWVREAACRIEGIKSAEVEVVWTPPWNPEMATEDARMELGLY